MALLTPHSSNVGIATANGGGRAAPMRSASEFFTPGDQSRLRGLDDLGRGLEKLGRAVFNYGMDDLRQQNATDMLADKVAYEDALREFDSQYRESHKGVDARTAAEDYNAFHDQQLEKLKERWGENKFLMAGAEKMAQGIREGSMQRAVAWRDQQEQFYKESVLEAAQAQAMQLFADPTASLADKQAALADQENNIRLLAGQRREVIDGVEQWTGGLDVGGKLLKLRGQFHNAHVSALIATDKLGAAKAYIKANQKELGIHGLDLLHRIDSKIQANAAKAVANSNKAARDILGGLKDAEYAAQNMGDVDRLNVMASQLEKLGKTKEAAALRERASFWREQREAVSAANSATMPDLAQKITDINKQMESTTDVAEHKKLAGQFKALSAIYKTRATEYNQDPAMAASRTITLPDNATASDVATLRLDAQARSKVPEHMQKVLTNGEARSMKNQYESLQSADQRLAWIEEQRRNYGDKAGMVLAEAGLPASVVALSPIISRMGQKGATTLMQASTMKLNDVPGIDNDTRKNAQDAARNSAWGKAVTTLAQRYPGYDNLNNMAKGTLDMLATANALGMSADDIEKEISATSSDKAVLVVPRSAGIDVDEAEAALDEARNDIVQKLLETPAVTGKTGNARRRAEVNIRSTINNGVFVTDGIGGTAILLDPTTGRPVGGADGKPVRIDLARAISDRQARAQATTEEEQYYVGD